MCKNKKGLLWVLPIIGILSARSSVYAVPPMLASIGIFGPRGEVLVYEKKGDMIRLRVCAKNTLRSEIESSSGCPLAPGTSEVMMSEHVFRDLVESGLQKIDKSVLSPESKKRVERDLCDLPNLIDVRKQFADLKQQLQRVQNFEAENPKDYDVNEAMNLEEQISQCSTDLFAFGDIFSAKNEVASEVDGLIRDMNDRPIKRVLKRSEYGDGVAYNLLRSLASMDTCDPNRVAQSPRGYICRAETVIWKVEKDSYDEKRVYRDLNSGMKVTEPLGISDQYKAADFCKNGYRLPSGYPPRLNGQYDFPNHDSDFAALEKDGIRQVVPRLQDHWFWSSTVSPYNAYDACGFNGGNGYVGYNRRDFGSVAIVCVSGP